MVRILRCIYAILTNDYSTLIAATKSDRKYDFKQKNRLSISVTLI